MHQEVKEGAKEGFVAAKSRRSLIVGFFNTDVPMKHADGDEEPQSAAKVCEHLDKAAARLNDLEL